MNWQIWKPMAQYALSLCMGSMGASLWIKEEREVVMESDIECVVLPSLCQTRFTLASNIGAIFLKLNFYKDK